jgi:glycosyltransferase involved in cell wall biosynthesis
MVVFDLPGADVPLSVDGVDIVVRRPYSARQRFIGKVREAANIWKALATVKAAVVVSRSAGPHVGLAALFARLSGRRFVYSSANVSDFDFGRLAPKRRDQELFRLGVRLANEVVVQTEEQVRLCAERFGRSCALVRSIAEPALLRRRAPEAFLWVGRMVWYKQPLAFVELARALPEAKFWMVGVPVPNTSGGPKLVADVARAAAEVPNLELLPPRPRPELMELVDRAVAVVNTADFEGMPNVFLEGWARGVPALALSHDPDGVIEHHGLGAFANGSPDKLVDLARRLWQERADQGPLAERSRRYIAVRHSADAVAAQWQEALGIGHPTSAPSSAAFEAR